MTLSALAVQYFRSALLEPFAKLKTSRDVYTLPAPQQTVVLSLGYRAALADLIYAHVLVSYGLHFQEKRLFETVGQYLKTINELDPKFGTPYLFADTLLTLQPKAPPLEHYVMAREILLRGTRERPFDALLWMSAGQYLAYLAPPHLPSEQQKNAWQREGAQLLTRACELQSDDENIPYQCIVAAGMLNRSGMHEANIQFLERFLAVNDDPEVRARAESYLRKALKAQGKEMVELHSRRFREAWKADLGFASQDMALVVGPGFDPAACVQPPGGVELEGCATAWRELELTP
jgi:tetratricopeptide (TPR) repeat protein